MIDIYDIELWRKCIISINDGGLIWHLLAIAKYSINAGHYVEWYKR